MKTQLQAIFITAILVSSGLFMASKIEAPNPMYDPDYKVEVEEVVQPVAVKEIIVDDVQNMTYFEYIEYLLAKDPATLTHEERQDIMIFMGL